jgi:hypothetical protein
MDLAIIEDRIAVAERRFRRACEQIVHLNYRLSGLERRYAKSKREQQRTFRYSLRLRMAVVDGLRDVYYEFTKCILRMLAILICTVFLYICRRFKR